MRPRSIVQFERVYAASLVLSVISVLLLLARPGGIAVPLNAPPAVAANVGTITTVSAAIGLAIGLLFLYFIARRASTVAKWIFVIFAGLGILVLLRNLALGLVPHGLAGVIAAIQTVLQLVAIYLLFRPDSEAWFRARRG